jgi:hypothetical protein
LEILQSEFLPRRKLFDSAVRADDVCHGYGTRSMWTR